jgi:AcrR family transcriptional regulator
MNECSFIIYLGKKMADRETRKAKLTARRQKQILKAAMEVFSSKGFAAATIPEIAGLAGVAAGTIYIYYPSKRELFVAVIKNFVITTPFLKLVDKIPQDDTAFTLKKILQDRLELIEKSPVSRMPSLMGEVQRDPELKAIWTKQFLQPFLERLEGMYRFLIATGKIKQIEPAVATRIVGGLIVGFLILKLMEGEYSPIKKIPQEKVAGEIVDFILYGLLNNAGDKKHKEKSR